jgi:hypothetical protein
MREIVAVALAVTLSAASAASQDVTEPKSGVAFAPKVGDMSLLGVGLRTKTMLKVKVYAVGLYVADSALAGPLAALKGKTDSPAFYRELVTGDFPKEIRLKFVRDLSAEQIQSAFREVLTAADPAKTNLFVNYFGELKSGQEAVLHYSPGGNLEVSVAGLGKPPINDKKFSESVFAIWLGDKPIQDDIKKALVSRADQLLK